MHFTLKHIALAGLLATLGASAFATTYFYVQPKSSEMSKVSPLSVTMAAATLPGATVGTVYNTSGFDFAPQLAVTGDPSYNAGLATFALTSGNMPAGMSLSSAGKLTGTPTAASASTTLQVAATYKANTGSQSYNWVAIASALQPDANWANVSLLLAGDGLNNGTVFTDLSPASTSVTVGAGLPVTSTTTMKYGTAALKFNGTSYLTTAPVSFGTGDFTIETWMFNAGSQTTNTDFINNGQFAFYQSSAGKLSFVFQSVAVFSSTATIPLNQWVHVAASRNLGVLKLYVNGVLGGTFNSTQSATALNTGLVRLGANASGAKPFTGYLDDVRITKNVGRYPADFTPPTASFPTN